MLQKLTIHNYAIIDHLVLEFGSGLNILTGETGAGKSIIVGAVSLLLGERATASMLRKGAQRGYVEGIFDLRALNGSGSQSAAGSENERERGQFTVKREITRTGSRVVINGRVSTIQELKRTFDGIIDLHGQHQHQSLLYPDRYYAIIDRYGRSTALAAQVAAAYRKISDLQNKKNALIRKEAELQEMRDYLEFQLREIQRVAPRAGEDGELEQEYRVLQNAEKIITMARECRRMLYDDEQSASVQIRNAQRHIDELRALIPEIAPVGNDLGNALVSVEESAALLQRYGEKIEHNPERLEEINERLAALRSLQKKYKRDIAGILDRQAEIEQSLASGDTLKDEIGAAEEELERERERYAGLCRALSKKRRAAARRLQKSIVERLRAMGMGKSLFMVEVQPRARTEGDGAALPVTVDGAACSGDANGVDDIQFLIATGKAERILPVSHIASGGEISRLMLAIKSVLMDADRIPVLIFDEIDSGISGRIAAAVGRELRKLAQLHQLLCVTHLPQIAGCADIHYSVEKAECNGRVVTRVALLDNDGRKREIAKLLAGDTVTETHLKSAEELLNARR